MNHARDDYLATEVLTASAEKLQLMLIEGALRLSHQARSAWNNRKDEDAHNALTRAQEIVAEMISGLNPKANPSLVERITEVYLFVYRALVAAAYERSEQKLAEAVRVLEVERETWRTLVSKSAKPIPAAGFDSISSGHSFVA